MSLLGHCQQAASLKLPFVVKRVVPLQLSDPNFMPKLAVVSLLLFLRTSIGPADYLFNPADPGARRTFCGKNNPLDIQW